MAKKKQEPKTTAKKAPPAKKAARTQRIHKAGRSTAVVTVATPAQVKKAKAQIAAADAKAAKTLKRIAKRVKRSAFKKAVKRAVTKAAPKSKKRAQAPGRARRRARVAAKAAKALEQVKARQKARAAQKRAQAPRKGKASAKPRKTTRKPASRAQAPAAAPARPRSLGAVANDPFATLPAVDRRQPLDLSPGSFLLHRLSGIARKGEWVVEVRPQGGEPGILGAEQPFTRSAKALEAVARLYPNLIRVPSDSDAVPAHAAVRTVERPTAPSTPPVSPTTGMVSGIPVPAMVSGVPVDDGDLTTSDELEEPAREAGKVEEDESVEGPGHFTPPAVTDDVRVGEVSGLAPATGIQTSDEE